MIAHDEYQMLEREVEALASDLDEARAERDMWHAAAARWWHEARDRRADAAFWRDCESVAARAYDRVRDHAQKADQLADAMLAEHEKRDALEKRYKTALERFAHPLSWSVCDAPGRSVYGGRLCRFDGQKVARDALTGEGVRA